MAASAKANWGSAKTRPVPVPIFIGTPFLTRQSAHGYSRSLPPRSFAHTPSAHTYTLLHASSQVTCTTHRGNHSLLVAFILIPPTSLFRPPPSGWTLLSPILTPQSATRSRPFSTSHHKFRSHIPIHGSRSRPPPTYHLLLVALLPSPILTFWTSICYPGTGPDQNNRIQNTSTFLTPSFFRRYSLFIALWSISKQHVRHPISVLSPEQKKIQLCPFGSIVHPSLPCHHTFFLSFYSTMPPTQRACPSIPVPNVD